MKIRHANIKKFRGINDLDWTVNGDFICLVGPGDSTKSTILDAIELALWPTWNVSFEDADFHKADTSEPIIISVTVGELPNELIKESRFGLHVRGWSSTEGLHDEPREGDELVLTVQLYIDSSLEPSWLVTNDRNPEGTYISAKNRALLGIGRLGSYVDWQLSWKRGSVLSKLTGEADEISNILADATRAARNSLSQEDLSKFNEIAQQAKKIGKDVGIVPSNDYKAALDIQSLNVGVGGITLHDGNIPLRRAGLGTRRLLSVVLKQELAKRGGITLIDEVEHSLEPHRIRRLIHLLKKSNNNGAGFLGQTMMTSHSPVVIVSLNSDNVRIVRNNNGTIKIVSIDSSLQNILRSNPDAFLGKKIIVCEGKTELGICKALDVWWSDEKQLDPFAYIGVIPAFGGGSDFTKTAKKFRALGYDVAVFGDSDTELNPTPDSLIGVGVEVILWSESKAIEERICLDLPWDGIKDYINLAIREKSLESVRDSINSQLEELIDGEINDWRSDENENALRVAIGEVSKNKNWFKRIDLGEELGEIIIKYLDSISDTDLANKISTLRKWVDNNE